jgi:hypothetical protein
MTERITGIVVTLIGLGVLVAVIGAVTMVALATTGDVGQANGCRSDVADAAGNHEVRGVNNDSTLSDAWQAKWRDFDAKLDAGQSASVSFTESESTSRSARYLDAKEAPLRDLIICFHEGEAEASANVDLPVLAELPGVGGMFHTNVLARGTIDFSGAKPKIVIREIKAGNLPADAAERLKGQIEDLVNDRINDLNLQHKHTPVFSEGSITINGTP